MIKIFTPLFIVFIAVSTYAQHKEYFPDSSSIIKQKLEDWQDLKFGLLMHWGPYSQWGIVESWSICPEDLSWAAYGRKKGISEKYDDYVKAYEQLQLSFNPIKFNPELWANAASDAGMKYVVFTTKHHDGFCMYDSKYTNYKITDIATPFHGNHRSDITKEIFKAFRKKKFWTGAYFSKPDWHSDNYWWKFFPPSDRNCNYAITKYPERWKKFVDYTHHQILELVQDYGKLDILWLDGGWVRKTDSSEIVKYLSETYEGSRWARNPQNQDIQMDTLVKHVRAIQQDILVVDRAVTGPYQNYLTPEQHIPEEGLPYPWETCMTMATSWSYVPNDVYKSSDDLIEKLVDIVSKGGNLLLNIGPSPEGTWDSVAYKRLQDIGRWMKRNGEAIYATRKFNYFMEDSSIHFTQSKDHKQVYILFSNEPTQPLTLSKLPYKKGMKATWLHSGDAIELSNETGNTRINCNPKKKINGEYVWVLKISNT
ncbi:MAG: alpha-L-fucosidase [Chitinophagaceae bacterium]|nr:alpha-L-fucosidase [Chitinophagaceae bacterium]